MKRRIWLVVRGWVPLLAVLVALIGGPALLAWLILGGPFGWLHVLIGVGVAAGLLLIGGLILGWALGKRLKGD
ncbi:MULTISPECIES: hypothetical protein [Chloroflexus]|uniref:Uncharacterized protein n=1 Tax=Chloroflexus aggregans (strain MD-66 / DSM 9485) TaxID=326427 RepID=B8G598_CHLAD|nr:MULTISPECIES: hypothetical protein [Chloroflexus]ACL25604.1 conserved hypothetical protein [Chloroflexus aggregans DSM 9485]GIV88066.1 MAG: hypothetical protein KatS3mg055_0584 [Chloroflexus sp.]